MKTRYQAYSCDDIFLTSRHKSLTSQHNNLTNDAEICHHALPLDDTCHFSNHMSKPRGPWAILLA